jgi:hypothetical protein
MSAPPHQVLNESVREVTPNVTSSSTVNVSNKHHLHINFARQSGQANIPCTPCFEGQCDELKGNVYDTTDIRQADQFIKITQEICDYIGRTYKYGMDMHLSIENIELFSIPQPTDPLKTQLILKLGSGKKVLITMLVENPYYLKM